MYSPDHPDHSLSSESAILNSPIDSSDYSSQLDTDADISPLVEEIHCLHLRLSDRRSPTPSEDPSHDRSLTEELGLALQSLINVESTRRKALQLQGEGAQHVLDATQSWLSTVSSSCSDRGEFLSFLVKLAGASNRLPCSLFIRDVVIEETRDPWRTGGFADIFRGIYKGTDIVAKRVRLQNRESTTLRSKLCRETLVWHQLRHPYVLPFYGVDAHNSTSTTSLCLISPWMRRGTLCQYIKSDDYEPGRDLYRLLLETAEGLDYLHSENVVHGDIHWSNILIDEDCHAQLADFGLSMIIDTNVGPTTTTTSHAGNVYWTSPERLAGSRQRRSVTDDVYAFGCLCYAMFTKEPPFSDLCDYVVMIRVVTGSRPTRPDVVASSTSFIKDEMWTTIETCWHQVAANRPSMTRVLARLRIISQSTALNGLAGLTSTGNGNDVDSSPKTTPAQTPNNPCSPDLDVCGSICRCVNCTKGWTHLHWAACTGMEDAVQLLSEHDSNVDVSDSKGRTALNIATAFGHKPVFEALVSRGFSLLETTSKQQWTLLHVAASRGQVDIAKLILRDGFAVDLRSTEDWTPLHLASQYGREEATRFLIERGGDVNAVTKNGSTALILAAMSGHAKIVRVLIQHGASPDAADIHNRTALSWAAARGHCEVAQVLLDLGADLHKSVNAGGGTAFLVATLHGQEKMVRLFLDRGASVLDVDKEGSSAMHKAATKGHLSTLLVLLEHGAPIEAKTVCNWTPLHYACFNGQLNVARTLVDFGADISAVARYERTPLSMSAEKGHTDLVKYFLARGAKGVDRALFYASWTGQEPIVRLLLANGASLSYADNCGLSALHKASQRGHVSVIRTLLEQNADVGACTTTDWTPLHYACFNSHLAAAQLLVEHGADINSVTQLGGTPLSMAAQKGPFELVEFLLGHGANGVNLALLFASSHGHEKAVQLLLENNADVTNVDNFGLTALHNASYGGHTGVVRILLDRGSSVAARSTYAWTPLHSAAFGGHEDVATLLISHGAHPLAVNNQGRTPLSLASEKGHVAAIRILLPFEPQASQTQDTPISEGVEIRSTPS